MGSYSTAATFDQLLALCHRASDTLIIHREAFMATAEELQQSIDDLGVALEEAKARTMEDINALEAQIAALEAGQIITQEQIDEMDAQVDKMKADVEGFDPVADAEVDNTLPGDQPGVDNTLPETPEPK